jgi:hypothetical protein
LGSAGRPVRQRDDNVLFLANRVTCRDDDAFSPIKAAGGDAWAGVNGDDASCGALHRAGEVV